MTKDDFSRLQNLLDALGVLTSITNHGKGKNKQYHVIVNGELTKVYKQRIMAKKYIINLFHVIQTITDVCYVTGTNMKQVTSQSKKRELVEARYIIFKLVRQMYPNISQRAIAYVFKKKHPAIIYGLKMCQQYMEVDPAFMDKYIRCSAYIKVTI